MYIRESIDFPVDVGSLLKKFKDENVDVRKNWNGMWIPNLKRNLSEVKDFGKHSVFGLSFNNEKTAVLVGGGPSLARNVDVLKGMDRSKCTVFTSSHSLKFLLKNGVVPDYVMVIDAKDIQAEWLDIGDTKGIKLMMEIGASPKIFDTWKGEFFFFRAQPKEDFPELWEISDFDGVIYGGGNVMTSLLTFVVDSAKFKRVVFVGHDYCNNVNFGVEYADGSVDEGKEVKEPFEDYTFHVDVNGYGKPTLERMVGYKLWTDLFVTKHDKVEFINATEGGILGAYPTGNIKSLKQVCLKDVEDLWHMQAQH